MKTIIVSITNTCKLRLCIIGLLLCTCMPASTQMKGCYEDFKQAALLLWKNKNYDNALKQLSAAKACSEAKAPQQKVIDSIIKRISDERLDVEEKAKKMAQGMYIDLTIQESKTYHLQRHYRNAYQSIINARSLAKQSYREDKVKKIDDIINETVYFDYVSLNPVTYSPETVMFYIFSRDPDSLILLKGSEFKPTSSSFNMKEYRYTGIVASSPYFISLQHVKDTLVHIYNIRTGTFFDQPLKRRGVYMSPYGTLQNERFTTLANDNFLLYFGPATLQLFDLKKNSVESIGAPPETQIVEAQFDKVNQRYLFLKMRNKNYEYVKFYELNNGFIDRGNYCFTKPSLPTDGFQTRDLTASVIGNKLVIAGYRKEQYDTSSGALISPLGYDHRYSINIYDLASQKLDTVLATINFRYTESSLSFSSTPVFFVLGNNDDLIYMRPDSAVTYFNVPKLKTDTAIKSSLTDYYPFTQVLASYTVYNKVFLLAHQKEVGFENASFRFKQRERGARFNTSLHDYLMVHKQGITSFYNTATEKFDYTLPDSIVSYEFSADSSFVIYSTKDEVKLLDLRKGPTSLPRKLMAIEDSMDNLRMSFAKNRAIIGVNTEVDEEVADLSSVEFSKILVYDLNGTLSGGPFSIKDAFQIKDIVNDIAIFENYNDDAIVVWKIPTENISKKKPGKGSLK